MTEEYFEIEGRRFVLSGEPVIPLFQHKEDIESRVFLNSDGNPQLRPCAYSGGCPSVFTLLTPPLKTVIDKHWQLFTVAINYNMGLEDVSSIFDGSLAFCNGTGWRSEPLRNFILGKDLNAVDHNGNPAYPKFDKDRTCSRATMAGRRNGNYVRLTMFNGNLPPPLKPGRTYPQTVQDVNFDDYLFNPRDHRYMFFAANVVASKTGGQSSVAPFPRGALYDWTKDGMPYTWLPHVSRHTIDYPLDKLIELPLGAPIPSPYRIVR